MKAEHLNYHMTDKQPFNMRFYCTGTAETYRARLTLEFDANRRGLLI